MRDPMAEPIATPVTLRRRPMPDDRPGCSRDCIDEHDYVWGRCEHATPPPPRLGLTVSETFIASDGHLSMRLRHLTVEEAKQRIAEFEGSPTLRGLIRAARAAGMAPRRDRDAEYADRRRWQAVDDRDMKIVFVAHTPESGWKLVLLPESGESVLLCNPTVDRIAAAARLVGWDLGSTT